MFLFRFPGACIFTCSASGTDGIAGIFQFNDEPRAACAAVASAIRQSYISDGQNRIRLEYLNHYLRILD